MRGTALDRVFIETWTHEPPEDTDEWNHEVDLDLDVSGGIALSGCLDDWRIGTEAPSGEYRARISGGDYAGATSRTSGGVYRLRLWPRTATSDPVLRRCWPGWRRDDNTVGG